MAAIVQQWVDENNNKEEESTPAAIEICEYIMSMASDDDTSVEDLTSVIVGLDISSHFNEMDLNKQTQLVENSHLFLYEVRRDCMYVLGIESLKNCTKG